MAKQVIQLLLKKIFPRFLSKGVFLLLIGMMITVTAKADPPVVSVNKTNFCQGDFTAELSIFSSDQAYFFYWQKRLSDGSWQDISSQQYIGVGLTKYFTPDLSNTLNYRVRYSVNINMTGGSNTSPLLVTVNPLPNAAVAAPSTICNGTPISLGSTAVTGSTYSWSSSVGTYSSTSSNPIDYPNTTQTYTLTETITTTGCSYSNDVTINVNQRPTATITSGSLSICEGSTTKIIGTLIASGNWTLTYSDGNGISGFGNASLEYTVGPNIATTYSISSLSDSKCDANNSDLTGSAIISIKQVPSAPVITSNSPICEGATLTLTTANVTGGTFSWTGVNSFSSSVQNPSIAAITTAASGDYTATVTVDGCTSAASDLISVVVNAKPAITASANKTSICAGESVTLTASGAGSSGTYAWDDGSTSNLISLSTSSSKTYSVTGTDANGCTNSSAVSITVNAIPTFTIIGNAVCTGNLLSIAVTPATGGVADYNYTWTVPFGAVAPGSVPSFSTTVPGIYTGKIKDKNTECESINQTVTATFYPLPSAAAIVASDNKVMEGESLNLTAAASGGTGAYTYTWVPNATTNYTITGGENALFNAIKEGIVNIKYQVKDANNCLTQSADLAITIAPATIIFDLPNAFTPNGDGKNDVLKLITNAGVNELRSFKIFSRSGNLVFESRDVSRGWDGRYNGNLLPIDIYYWTAVYVDRNNVTNSKTGTVLLLK